MRVLSLDIETSPSLVYTWGLFDQNIPIEFVKEPGRMICWSAKWVGEKEVHFADERIGRVEMLSKLRVLLDQADAVLTYNGKRFDIPIINAEFIMAGIRPSRPARQIDVLETAKGQFRFLSNKLEFVSKALGLEGKVKHRGMQLWFDCMAGNKRAWREMRTYNQGDVVLLEKAYTIILPWIKSHPNVGQFDGTGGCPNCGSNNLQSRGVTYTAVNSYQRYVCLACGKWSRGGENLSKGERVMRAVN